MVLYFVVQSIEGQYRAPRQWAALRRVAPAATRLREGSHGSQTAHGDHEPGRPVRCPRFSAFRRASTLKGGHRTRRFRERRNA